MKLIQVIIGAQIYMQIDETNRVVRTNQTYLPGIEIRDALMKVPGYAWLIGNSHLYSATRERAAAAVKRLLDRQQSKVEEQNVEQQTVAIDTASSELVVGLDEALILAVQEKAAEVGAEII